MNEKPDTPATEPDDAVLRNVADEIVTFVRDCAMPEKASDYAVERIRALLRAHKISGE